jgi:hypothetical protein
MSTLKLIAAVAVLAAGAVTVAQAHHSVSAQFATDGKILKTNGVLKKVEWINPHPYITFQMKGPDGKTQDWAMESMAPAALRRAGLPGREALKVGTTYPVFYYPAKNGKPVGLLMAFTLPDGKTIGALSQRDLEGVKAAR